MRSGTEDTIGVSLASIRLQGRAGRISSGGSGRGAGGPKFEFDADAAIGCYLIPRTSDRE